MSFLYRARLHLLSFQLALFLSNQHITAYEDSSWFISPPLWLVSTDCAVCCIWSATQSNRWPKRSQINFSVVGVSWQLLVLESTWRRAVLNYDQDWCWPVLIILNWKESKSRLHRTALHQCFELPHITCIWIAYSHCFRYSRWDWMILRQVMLRNGSQPWQSQTVLGSRDAW